MNEIFCKMNIERFIQKNSIKDHPRLKITYLIFILDLSEHLSIQTQ